MGVEQSDSCNYEQMLNNDMPPEYVAWVDEIITRTGLEHDITKQLYPILTIHKVPTDIVVDVIKACIAFNKVFTQYNNINIVQGIKSYLIGGPAGCLMGIRYMFLAPILHMYLKDYCRKPIEQFRVYGIKNRIMVLVKGVVCIGDK
jgi:hypothetical protein